MSVSTTTPSPHLLAVSQLVFNIGFYAVVPFLALFMREDLQLSGMLIGLVLGLRTFSQQGMFLFGGALADRFGGRALMLLGCLIRVTGFMALAFAHGLPLMIVGACLTGIGGAMFSPALEALMARAGTLSEAQGGRSRARWFAWLSVCGETGAVIGPVLGAALMGVGFQEVAFGGALVFTIALLALYWRLPRDRTTSPTSARQPLSLWQALRDRPFMLFALAYSSYLLSYNQLYLALPVELTRIGSNEAMLGPLFMIASLLIITLQLPLSRWAQRWGGPRTLMSGFGLLFMAFVVMALCAPWAVANDTWRYVPAVALVVLLTCGQMLIVPAGMEHVARLAPEGQQGAYYGALASAGGVAVLLGNLLCGRFLDLALVPSTMAALPWALLALFPAMSVVLLAVLLRSRDAARSQP